MGTERIGATLAGALLALVMLLGPADVAAASTTEDTAPPTTETSPEPEETTDATDADETQSEPGEVSPWVWIGVFVLLAAAIVWTVRRGSTSTPTDEADADPVIQPDD